MTREQQALTARFLIPAQDAIHDYLMAMRNDLDPGLSARYPTILGKPYPLGRCLEITQAVQKELMLRLQKPTTRAERAIHAFMSAGGVVRPIWGVLRQQFFQNATQFGSLYIDVSNDTVTITKPKVEILPLAECGMESIRDLEHFSVTAGRYWGASIVANHLVPELAPALPMLAVLPGQRPQLQSATDYMIGLMMRDNFSMAEAWVRDMPPPSPETIAACQQTMPEPFKLSMDVDRRAAAIAACQLARRQGAGGSTQWRNETIMKYLAVSRSIQGGLSSANSSTSPP